MGSPRGQINIWMKLSDLIMESFRRGPRYRHDFGGTKGARATVEKLIDQLGLTSYGDSSRISASRYLVVGRSDQDDTVKIRISDHDDRHGGNDYNLFVPVGSSPDYRSLIEFLGNHFDCQEKAQTLIRKLEIRQEASRRAAETRREKAIQTHAEIVNQLVAWLQAGNRLQKSGTGLPRSVNLRHISEVPLLAGLPKATAKKLLDRALLVIQAPQIDAQEQARRKAQSEWAKVWGVAYQAHMQKRPPGVSRYSWNEDFFKDHPEAKKN